MKILKFDMSVSFVRELSCQLGFGVLKRCMCWIMRAAHEIFYKALIPPTTSHIHHQSRKTKFSVFIALVIFFISLGFVFIYDEKKCKKSKHFEWLKKGKEKL
jgi:hypothetical protein